MSTWLCFCLLLLGVQNAMPTPTNSKPTGKGSTDFVDNFA